MENKIYKKYCYGVLAQCARVVRFKNGKYGFETSSYRKFEIWEKNVNMPSFPTEEAAREWIENNSKWQSEE